ncbi:MAG: hypothetical protein ACREXI_08485 [Caldimonas sp.]
MNPVRLDLDISRTQATPLDQIGFELGWDYAHHRFEPPLPYAEQASSLRQGLLAGRATFGLRTLQATRPVRKWLQLRLHAWLRGRSVELFQVTPNYLRQLEVSHCPITRVALSVATLAGSDSSVDRVRNDAGYAAGNLAVMSTKANHAKAAHGYRSARRLALHAAAADGASIDASGSANARALDSAGLTAAQWARIATLCSFVELLPHEEAVTLPLRVLPPNRLRLLNPVQALQAMLSRQLLQPGWSRRCARFEALLKGKEAKRDFRAFVIALLPRVLEAGRLTDPLAMRWAVEDAWSDTLVQKRWQAFAGPLGAEACAALVQRAAAKKLATVRVVSFQPAHATEGWDLETRGYVVAPGSHDKGSAYGPQLALALQPG